MVGNKHLHERKCNCTLFQNISIRSSSFIAQKASYWLSVYMLTTKWVKNDNKSASENTRNAAAAADVDALKSIKIKLRPLIARATESTDH